VLHATDAALAAQEGIKAAGTATDPEVDGIAGQMVLPVGAANASVVTAATARRIDCDRAIVCRYLRDD
jgi:hypothetical protein